MMAGNTEALLFPLSKTFPALHLDFITPSTLQDLLSRLLFFTWLRIVLANHPSLIVTFFRVNHLGITCTRKMLILERYKMEGLVSELSFELFHISWTHPRELFATMARKFVSLLWMSSALVQLSPAESYRVPHAREAAKYTNRAYLLS